MYLVKWATVSEISYALFVIFLVVWLNTCHIRLFHFLSLDFGHRITLPLGPD